MIQEWCIYGMIYHYAPFLLSNPMVTFSGPNYFIPNEVPNPSPILKEHLSALSVWQFPGGYQKTIQGPQPPGPAGVGLSILIRTILREIIRGYQLFQSFSRHKVLSIPWTTQLFHTGSNQVSCMALAHLGQFIFHSRNSVTQFNSQDGQNCMGPIQTIQPGD
ncbi:hypothetical protein O181_113126 [Austropuccinia psidii MF-1]|uniref:Uncharacterized protein n=1 Tax=Austropuccinia psidii MF-1 TaxID=1389203 RepID=A0A9Q3PU52_9BASI|nr:hypothetical protein [Austropuccinia psidii MF-1]